MNRVFDFVKSYRFVIVFILIFSFLNIKLVSDTFYIDELSNIHSTQEGYGDVPLHLTQVSKFGFSNQWNLDDPIFFGSFLQYPFIFNLIRGIILNITNSWNVSVLWLLYFLVFCNIFLVFYIYKKILVNKYLAILSLVIFFLGSGINWLYSIFNGLSFSTFKLDLEYPLQNISFGPPMMSIVHQHTFHFGLFLFLLSIFFLIKFKDKSNIKFLILSIFTTVLLPLSHMHSFVVLGLFIFGMIVVALYFSYKNFAKYVFIAGIVSLVLSLPQIFYLMSGKFTNSFSSFRVGWMINDGIGSVNFLTNQRSLISLPFFNFIFVNFGIILPTFIFGIFIYYFYLKNLRVQKNIENNIYLLSVFVFVGIITFFVSNLIQFQPWDFDNNKILIYFLFFIAPVIVWSFSRFFERNKIFANLILILISISICLTGFADLYYRLKYNKNDLPIIFDINALNLANYVKDNIKEDDLILTGTTHRNPISSLAGRQILIGYEGWLWTRGIDYVDRYREVESFYVSPKKESDILSKYNIKYILLDVDTIKKYKISRDFFDKNFLNVYHNDLYDLYLVK